VCKQMVASKHRKIYSYTNIHNCTCTSLCWFGRAPLPETYIMLTIRLGENPPVLHTIEPYWSKLPILRRGPESGRKHNTENYKVDRGA
jgi:hypothetical protein